MAAPRAKATLVNASADAAVPAITVQDSTSVVVLRSVAGSMMWCRRSPSAVQVRNRDVDVATPPSAMSKTPP